MEWNVISVTFVMCIAKSRKSVHFNEEVEVQIVESPAVEVVEVSEVRFLLVRFFQFMHQTCWHFMLNYVLFLGRIVYA